MHMSPSSTPFYIFTPERYHRVLAMHEDGEGELERFRSICPACGLPGRLDRPARNGRSWVGTCEQCGTTSFCATPSLVYAPTELLRYPAAESITRLQSFIASLHQLGAAELRAGRWDRVLHGSKERVQFSRLQACTSCSNEASAFARRDRYGRGYLVCGACRKKVFHRADHTLEAALGWTAWLRTNEGASAWDTAWKDGKARWSHWLDLQRLDGSRASTASQHQTHRSHQAEAR